MIHLGHYNTSSSRTHVGFQFSTHAATGGNVAPSSAIDAADIRIYRAADGAAFSATQRSSSSGITVTSPFDSLVGFHDVDIDLTDNDDAGFYASGYRYSVVLAPNDETIDSQTITGVVLAVFEIGPANVVLANSAHGGTSATLRLGGASSTPAFYVTNSGGDAAKFEATGGNGIGFHVDGDGSGAGLRATGGASGNGAHFSGGASGGNGLRIFGASAHALHAEVDANDLHGAYFQGQRNGHGICAVGANGDGTGTGDGLNVTSSGVGVGLRAGSMTVTSALTAGTNAVPWNAAWGDIAGTADATYTATQSLLANDIIMGAQLTSIGEKTTNLPASPAAVGSAMTLADGAITEAKISTPAEASGRPTGILAMIRRLFEGRHNKRTRNRTTGVVAIRNAADDGNLESATQSSGTVGSDTVDSISQGA